MTIRPARRPLPKRIAAAVTAALAALHVHEQSREPLPEGVCAYLRRALERIIDGEARLRNALDTSSRPRATLREATKARRKQPVRRATGPLPDFIAAMCLESKRSTEWLAFYGVRQALQFMHPADNERAAIEQIGFAGRIGQPLSAKQLALLRRMLTAATSGESDTWRAVSLSSSTDRRPPNTARAARVLHALVKRRRGSGAGDAAGAVAYTWNVDAAFVEKEVRAHRQPVDEWLARYLNKHARAPERHSELLAEMDAALGTPATVAHFSTGVTPPATPETAWQSSLPRVG